MNEGLTNLYHLKRGGGTGACPVCIPNPLLPAITLDPCDGHGLQEGAWDLGSLVAVLMRGSYHGGTGPETHLASPATLGVGRHISPNYYPFQAQCYIVFCGYLQGSLFDFNDFLTKCSRHTTAIYGLIVVSQIFILKELTLDDTKPMSVSHKIPGKGDVQPFVS